MLCFRVTHNATLLCLAGVGDTGVLSTIISWVGGHDPETCKSAPYGPVDLHVGGLRGDTHMRWVDGFQHLALGDTVLVEIVEAETADAPVREKSAATNQTSAGQETRQCAWCARGTGQVSHLIDGPTVSICKDCVETCNALIAEMDDRTSK